MKVNVILENMQFEQKSVGTAYAGTITKAMEYVNMPEGLIDELIIFPDSDGISNFKIMIRSEFSEHLGYIKGQITMSNHVTVYVDTINFINDRKFYNLTSFKKLVSDIVNFNPFKQGETL